MDSTSASYGKLRLVGTWGANRAMEAELKRLGKRALEDFRAPKARREDEGTLVFPFDPELAWLACRYMRTPSRVLWDLFETSAARLEPLYDAIVEWLEVAGEGWLEDAKGLSVRARDVQWFPASRTQIQGTVKNGIIDGAKRRGISLHLEADDPDLSFSVRGTEERLVVSLDLGGSMTEHGYRIVTDRAPLRENVAAQVLMLARWQARDEILVDPMTGSGTFAIEASLMATATAHPHVPPAARLPLYRDRDPREDTPLFDDAAPVLFANDHHAPSVRGTRKNAEQAGVADQIGIIEGDFRDLDVKTLRRHAATDRGLSFDKGLIVCNPPYGDRLGAESDADLETLYEAMGDWFERFGPGWRMAVVCAHPSFERAFGRQPRMKKPMPMGGHSPMLFLYELG